MKIAERQLRRIIREEISRDPKTISEISIAPFDALEVLRAITTVVGVPALLKKSSPDTYDKINNVLDKARPVGNAVTAATGIAAGDVKGTAAQAVVAALSNPRVSGAIRDRAPEVYDKAVDVVDKVQKADLGSSVVNTLTRTSL